MFHLPTIICEYQLSNFLFVHNPGKNETLTGNDSSCASEWIRRNERLIVTTEKSPDKHSAFPDSNLKQTTKTNYLWKKTFYFFFWKGKNIWKVEIFFCFFTTDKSSKNNSQHSFELENTLFLPFWSRSADRCWTVLQFVNHLTPGYFWQTVY